MDKKLRRQLEAIDWDFPVSHPGVSRAIHWYPGTFPSQLPSAFIQAFSNKQDIIFDPYGGIGTTASEALRLGRKAWIVDVNPVGILANYQFNGLILIRRQSNDKFKYFIKYIESILLNVGHDLVGYFDDDASSNIHLLDRVIDTAMRPLPADLLNKVCNMNSPNWDELEKWIHLETLSELKSLYSKLTNINSSMWFKVFVIAMFSANIRALCSQNKSWGHIADNVYPKNLVRKSASTQFRKWLKIIKNNILSMQLESLDNYKTIQYWADLHDWNSTKGPTVKPKKRPHIIITSPPYGDAIDYVLSQRLSLYLLGYSSDDISILSQKEIGARRKRFKKTSRQTWADELKDAAMKQSLYLDNSIIVTILPHKNHGREIGENLITKGLQEIGWNKTFTVDRSISQKKARQSWTSIKQETINIFTKG